MKFLALLVVAIVAIAMPPRLFYGCIAVLLTIGTAASAYYIAHGRSPLVRGLVGMFTAGLAICLYTWLAIEPTRGGWRDLLAILLVFLTAKLFDEKKTADTTEQVPQT